MLSDEEFEKLKLVPFEELTTLQKMQVNLHGIASLPDNEFSAFFDNAINSAIVEVEDKKRAAQKKVV